MPFDDDTVPMGLLPQQSELTPPEGSMQRLLQGAPTSLAQPEVTAPAPSFPKLFEDYTRSQNIWVGLAQSATRPGRVGQRDPDFDPWRNTAGYEDHHSAFIGAYDEEDVRDIKLRIDEERKRNEHIANGGWAGTAAMIAAGSLDPLMWVPIGEAVHVARIGGATLSAAARAGLTLGGITAAEEAVLHGTQITRDPAESAINVAMSTALGGLMGGAAGAVMSRATARSAMRGGETFERELSANTGGDPLGWRPGGEGGSVGSAAVPRYQMSLDDLTMADALGVPNALARTSPTLRLGTSPSSEVRRVALELADQPLDIRANAEGIPTPISVERLIMQHMGPLAEGMQEMDDAFVQYRLGRDRQRFDMTKLGARDVISGMLGRERTMLTYDEFKEAIGRAMRRGDVSDIPEVAQAAAMWRKKVFDPLKEKAIAAGLLPEDVAPEGAISYFSRIYNTAKISANRARFEKILTDWLNTTSHDPNLTQLDLQDIARQVTDQLMNMGPNRSSYGGIVPLARGPLKGRTLSIPDTLIEDFLEHDVGRIARAYTRTMGADVELTRAFGRADMQDQLDRVREHYAVLRAAAQGKVIPPTPAAGALEGGIAGDWARQLVAAGRPEDEADVAGAFIQAYYERRAAEPQFRGMSAEDLYRRDMAQVRAGEAGEGLAPGELAQRGVTDTVKIDNAKEAARTDQGEALSARVPTGKDAPANRWTDADAIPDLATLESNERLFNKTVDAVGDEVGMGHNGGPPLGDPGASRGFANTKEKAEYLIGRLKDNLLWLWDQVPPEIRERSKLWYDGAQAISTEWGARWDKTRSQVAGMLAVLSPQKDWFMNTTMAERIGDIMHLSMGYRWDERMDAQAFKFLLGETATSAENRAAYAAIKGKTLREVLAAGGPLEHAGMWLRAYDEAYHSAAHAIITPEGAYSGNMLTQAGDEARRAWSDFEVIGRAASIFMDGSPENISRMLGEQHKVRNFYNNIFHANDPRYVTVDTHAVAADLLRPLANKDKAVSDNFRGTGTDAATGLSGSYALHAEAYRRAAAERGVLPRELQSVTWEAVRGLFPDNWKTEANKNAVNEIWRRVGAGELSIQDARAEVNQLAGGIEPPTWIGTGVDPLGRTSTYGATREAPRGPIITFEVAPDPRNAALVARWRAAPQELRDWISHKVAWQIGADILEGAGEALWGVGGKQRRPNIIKGELHKNDGAWRADSNPSLSLHLDPNTPAAKVGIIARLAGYALRQEEMLRTYPKPFTGGKDTGAVFVHLPTEATSAEVHAVYQKIYELADENGQPYVLGHTTGADRVMGILNNNKDAKPIETLELARLIDQKLAGVYDVKHGTIYAERVEAGVNDYDLAQQGAHPGRDREGVPEQLRRVADKLRASAEQQIDEHLRAHETGAGAGERGAAAEPRPGAAGEPGAGPSPRGPPAELEQAGRAKIRLGSSEGDVYPGSNAQRYPLLRGEERIGEVHVITMNDGKTAYIDTIEMFGGYELTVAGGRAGANQLGLRELRDIARQFFDDHPEVDVIQGRRVTGARAGTELADVLVSFTRDQVERGRGTAELEQAGRAKIRLGSAEAKDLITLFRNAADASSAFHEFAHQAAVQFFKDAAHELASDALRADARIFERWLGMEEGALALTREQQEKFATGMEQFLLTGEAPTKQLEGAFAKIKAWMQSIYQTVTELGTPIPDEVRDAFGRLFAAPEREVTAGGPIKFEGDAAIKALNDRELADLRDLAAIRDRVRGTFGLPDNPNGIWNRTYHVLKDVNYMRLLGGMTVSAFPDVGRTVMTHGMTRVLGDGVLPMLRDFTTYRLASGELKLAGNALDMVLDTRAMSLADMMDDYGRWSKYERGLKGMTERFGLVSLMAPWNAALKQFVAVVGQTRSLQAIEKLAAGEAILPAERTRLASLGIGQEMAERINTMFQEHGTKGEGGTAWWANTSAWTDRNAVEVYRAAMSKEVDTAIVTPGQERPLWTTSGNTWRLLAQFHSFSLASTQRVMMTGLQKRDMATLNGALIMVGLGMMSFLIGRAANPSAPPLPDLNTPGGWGQLVREGVDKSGLLGWLFDAHNMVEKASRGGVGLSRLTGGPPMSRYASRGVVESLLGPTVGLAEAGASALGSAGAGEWSGSDTKAVRRMLPFQNLIYLRWLFDAAENGLNRNLGIPEQAPRR